MKKLKNLSVLFTLLIIMANIIACSGTPDNASTVYADQGAHKNLSKESISTLEAIQNANRELTSVVLPSVVTLDVIELRKRPQNQGGMPWFFFGQPKQDNKEEKEYEAEGMGSGVIVRKTGKTYYALTNQHVVGTNAKNISVILYGGETVDAKIVGADKRKDVALVSFEYDKDLPVAKLGDSNTVQVGDLTYAMGAPMGLVSTVTKGIVSAIGRSGGPNRNNINDFIQTDAAINQGNSGGPLVNIYGEVIGINTWIVSSSGGSQGLAFSIPINNLKKAIDDFISVGKIKYGWLGVQLIPVSDEFKKSLNLKDFEGSFVGQVFLGSPADKGGLQAGDFITEINSKKIKSTEELVRQVGDLEAGEKTSFKLIRAGKEIIVNVKIEERNEDIVVDSSKLWPGFNAIPLNDRIIENMELPKGQTGVLIESVQPKSPGAVIALQRYDIITKVNGNEVKNIQDFYTELSKISGEMWFDFIRDGHKLSTAKIKK